MDSLEFDFLNGSIFNTIALAPLVVATCGTFLFLVLDLMSVKFSRILAGGAVCLATWILTLSQYEQNTLALGGLVRVDSFVILFYSIILIGSFLTICINDKQLAHQKVSNTFDVDVLVLISAIGAMVMVSASNLMVLFVGFEIMSLAVYALTASAKEEQGSTEAALKYFVLGAFSSAFMLYGMVLVYGATASLSYSGIATGLNGETSTLLLVGLGLLIFGFGFKASLVPFHFWAPDAYQGAPTSISAFMAVVVKAAAFGAFLRLMMTSFADVAEVWLSLLWFISLFTMTWGNIVALSQTSVKRMLAYSSIAHAGYALIGFLTIGREGAIAYLGPAATIFYLFAYGVMTIGAFVILLIVSAGTDAQYSKDSLDSFKGLGWRHPVLGMAMTICLCSLAGMPPLVGFVGKFHLFSAAISAGFISLAIIAALNSVLSLYYYLRVVVYMYFVDYDAKEENKKLLGLEAYGSRLALAVAVFATIYLGIHSEWLLKASWMAIKSVV